MAESEDLNKSVLERVLHPNTGKTESIAVEEGGCPNCAANGNASKLTSFECSTCGYVKPLSERSAEELGDKNE